jgi:bifunctional glutamyl/prolyl-tRNA synthetase
VEIEMLGDPELRKLKKGDIVQIQRRGFFIVDSPYKEPSPNSCKPANIRLIAIPDGTPTSYGPPGKAAVPQPSGQPSKGGLKKVEAPAKAAGKNENKSAAAAQVSASGEDLNDSITKQGDKVRQLKTEKADKAAVDAAVAALLDLKAKYKAATGKDWKPGQSAAPTKPATPTANNVITPNEDKLNAEIIAQGDKVRQFKTEKADKATVDAAVATLLDLKAKYKAATGKDWKPGQVPSPAKPATPTANDVILPTEFELNDEISAQGDKVRQLKADKADKATVDAAVAKLLELKAAYKSSTGKDWKPGAQPAKAASPPKATGEQQHSSNSVADQLSLDIVAQGDKVRQLKADKADKVAVDTAVNVLLGLKTKYKTLTGNDWKPASGNPGTFIGVG